MKMLSKLFVGIVIFTLVFTFMPTGSSGSEVVNSFVATKSYTGAIARSQSQLISSYVTDDNMMNEELDPLSTSTVIAQSGYIFSDKDGNGIDGRVSSPVSADREGRLHSGEDIVPVGNFSAYGVNEVFAVCPLPGTVKSAGYDTSQYSAGYNVTISVTPHVDIIYMHLGYGSGRAVQFSSYTTPQALIQRYPFQNVGYPDQWVTEEEWCKSHNVPWSSGLLRYIGPSSILVKQGDEVAAGAFIGVPGNTGNSTGLHSHFTLRYTDDNGNKYYGSISDLLSGTVMYELEWLSSSSGTYTTAKQAGWDLEELNIKVVKEVNSNEE